MDSASLLTITSKTALIPFLAALDPIDWGEAILHAAIVALSITVLSVSILAYFRRKTKRYMLLSLGFFFLFLSQLSTLLEVVFLSNALIIIPSIGLHLSHVFDFLTLIFFMFAMTGYGTGSVVLRRPPAGQNDSTTYANQKGESLTLEK
jgi:hypothetical protein